MNPKVSVVIPTCRRPELLRRCLDALLVQRYRHDAFEIVVVDDARSAETRMWVELLAMDHPRGPAIRYLQTPPGPHGPAAARNAGWRNAHGPVIAFTDDDTIPDPHWLQEGMRAMHGDVAAVCGRIVVPRHRGDPFEPRHADIAASLQKVLEESALSLAGWLREASGETRLCMAGGVALNCVMNARLRDSGLFDEVWVQPAAGDAGTALGAALLVDWREGSRQTHWQMDHAYLGPAWSDAQIEAALAWAKLPYRRLDDVAEQTAALLADNRIIGWYQGRMEFGPRALGARSILASPIDPGMQARLNELKDREDFRPVAPAVLEERLGDWFRNAGANQGRSPYMLFIYDLLPGKAEHIPAAVHVDGTARVQTVSADTNPAFHALLTAFEQRTGVPILVNTSFNVRGEPIVCTPRDAIDAFYSTPLDALVIGPFLLEKRS